MSAFLHQAAPPSDDLRALYGVSAVHAANITTVNHDSMIAAQALSWSLQSLVPDPNEHEPVKAGSRQALEQYAAALGDGPMVAIRPQLRQHVVRLNRSDKQRLRERVVGYIRTIDLLTAARRP